MKPLALPALLLAFLGCALATRPAAAGDYYLVYVETSPDDYWAQIIDPATIATEPNGFKTVRTANISPLQIWNDEKLEFDCAGGRVRTLTSVSHMAGSTLDRMTMGLHLADWSAPKSDEIGGLMLQTICNWSPSKMTANATYTYPDFETAESKLSDVLERMENKAKK